MDDAPDNQASVGNPASQTRFYSKLFLDGFDGRSEDMWSLTPTQRYVWLSYLTFARRFPPHGFINEGHKGNRLLPATIHRLAQWAGVNDRTIARTNERLVELGMLRLDKRRTAPCLEVANWARWQRANGADILADGDLESVPATGLRVHPIVTKSPPDGDLESLVVSLDDDDSESLPMSASPAVDGLSAAQFEELVLTLRRLLESSENLENGGGPLENPFSDSSPTTPEQPSPDSLSPQGNDIDERAETIENACAILAAYAEGDEGNLRVIMENACNGYPRNLPQVISAAMATASKCSAGKGHKWRDKHGYFQSALSGMVADAKEANAANPMRRPFVMLFGVEPRIPLEASQWAEELRKFRRAPQQYLCRQKQIHAADDPDYWLRLSTQAIELGVWREGVWPYLEAARQEKAELERTPGGPQRYQLERIEKLDADIEAMEKELSLEQG